MTAAHFAAALAIKSRVPKAPTWALVVGAFIPDFIWIALATAGIEPTKREIFFDDWSHSLLSMTIFAAAYALLFRRQGRGVAIAIVVAVLSHFVLDLPVHPRSLAIYPHSSLRVGLGLSAVAPMNYWYIQLVAVLLLLMLYVISMRKRHLELQPLFASTVLVLGWHVALMPG